jgi:SAM-dependent methyltransferase
MDDPQLDRWAGWLLHGRHRGAGKAEVRRKASSLRRVRERVLRGAQIRPGHRVLDVGAGTGLLATGARRRCDPAGRVVAIDLSVDALRVCRDEDTGVEVVAGDATALPFPDATFDVAVARSVLIYVRDKDAALEELYRVLREGGRVSIFEPINREYCPRGSWPGDLDEDVAARYAAVRGHLERGWEFAHSMRGFDERDLVRLLRATGFGRIELTYEYRYSADGVPSKGEIADLLMARPNPGMQSHEEAAREVFGDEAEDYLERLSAVLSSRPLRESSGAAYIVATR